MAPARLLNVHMSRPARKVSSALARLGVELDADGQFDLEVSCLRFWHAHIEGAVAQVMKGGDQMAKLERVHRMGWSYFCRPVRQMLSSRASARTDQWRGDPPADAESRRRYALVSRGWAVADFSLEDLARIMYDFPGWVASGASMENALLACRRQQVYSLPYLAAILEKDAASLEAGRRMPEGPPLFIPGARLDTGARDLSIEWEVEKAMGRHKGRGG